MSLIYLLCVNKYIYYIFIIRFISVLHISINMINILFIYVYVLEKEDIFFTKENRNGKSCQV